MEIILVNLITSLLAITATGVVALNFWVAISNLTRTQKGDAKRYSFVYIVPQLLLYLAALLSRQIGDTWIPTWSFAVIALADVSIWHIALLPIFSLIKKFRRVPS